MLFTYDSAVMTYSSEIQYQKDGQSIRTKGDVHVHTTYETKPLSDYGFAICLTLENRSDTDILIESAHPICVHDLKVDGQAPQNLYILNHGRHKNDLPSVCRPAVHDEAFSDAVGRLSEEGIFIDNIKGDVTEFVGDQIGILHADNMNLSFYFLSSDTQLTEITVQTYQDGSLGEIRVGGTVGCLLVPGAKYTTDWAAVDFRADAFTVTEDYAAHRAKSACARVGNTKPCVYSTWYYYGLHVTEENILTNLAEIEKQKLPFNCFQIDEGWQVKRGDWEANEKFPNGMKYIADKIIAAGMIPGIWTCPLICSPDSEISKKHPEWLLKNSRGDFCTFRMEGDQYVFDCTHPEVIDWIESLYRRLKEWGYPYHKLDFTRAFVIQNDTAYHNPYITPVQAYVNAMRAVRRGIGEDGYLLICGGLYDPLIGICDAQRTGSDVQSRWFMEDGKLPKIPFTVKQNILRYFMNDWWHNDPDSLMVRRNEIPGKAKHLTLGLLSDEEAVTFTANQYFGGGLIGSTEPLDTIDKARLLLLRHVMPPVDTRVRPRNLFLGERFISEIDVCVRQNYHTVCFINWTDEEQFLSLHVDESLAEEGKRYYVSTFFEDTLYENIRLGENVSLGRLAPHATQIVKIADMDVPQIIKSDAHFSMGGEVKIIPCEDGWLIQAENLYNCQSNYTLALPDGRKYDFSLPPYGKMKEIYK